MRRALAQPAGMTEVSAPRGSERYGLPVRLLISGFIVCHILATLLWILPPSALRQQLFALPQHYISQVGLWQSWGMFAPQPSNLNLYLSAVVSYADGSQREWVWPRPEQLDLFTRYREERYRKFTEYGRLDAYSYLWPSMAQFAAQQLPAHDPANPAVRVQLWRHWWVVPPPPQNGDLSHEPPHQWNQYRFFDTPLPLPQLPVQAQQALPSPQALPGTQLSEPPQRAPATQTAPTTPASDAAPREPGRQAVPR